MILLIRISGKVNINGQLEETLQRFRLGNKYTAAIIKGNKENIGMIQKIRNCVAYGTINRETLIKLIKARGKAIVKTRKVDAEKIAEEFEKGKEFEDLGIKPYFRLHPPRGGLKSSKLHFPRGVLGNHGDKINILLEKML